MCFEIKCDNENIAWDAYEKSIVLSVVGVIGDRRLERIKDSFDLKGWKQWKIWGFVIITMKPKMKPVNYIVSRFWRRLAATVVVLLLVLYMVCSCLPDKPVCFFEKEWNDHQTLENVKWNFELQILTRKNIFFHETSCVIDGVVKLTSRQACAIESAGISY